MTMTPEQLREWAAKSEARLDPVSDPAQLRAHAAALEEVERLKAERDRAFDTLAIDAVQYDALLAERDRERKEHAQWVRDHQADTDAAHLAKQRAEAELARLWAPVEVEGIVKELNEASGSYGSCYTPDGDCDESGLRDTANAYGHLFMQSRAMIERLSAQLAERDADYAKLKAHANDLAGVSEEYWSGNENESAMADALAELAKRVASYRRDYQKDGT